MATGALLALSALEGAAAGVKQALSRGAGAASLDLLWPTDATLSLASQALASTELCRQAWLASRAASTKLGKRTAGLDKKGSGESPSASPKGKRAGEERAQAAEH